MGRDCGHPSFKTPSTKLLWKYTMKNLTREPGRHTLPGHSYTAVIFVTSIRNAERNFVLQFRSLGKLFIR